MKRALTIALTALFGCAVSGCYTAKLSPAGEKVLSTVNPESVRTCKSLGVVTAKSRQGGVFGQGVGASNVDTGLKNKTAELGGNVLLIAKADAGFGGASGRGEAYKCEKS